MKRILVFALMGIMIFTGCSKTATSDAPEENKTNQEESADASEEAEAAEEAENSEDAALKEALFTEGTEFPQLEMPVEGEEIAVITTNYGVMKVKFCPEEAPKAVENFVTHAKNGYYDSLIFHRVINDFMIQGGDPEGTGRGGTSIWGEKFEDEFTGDMYHFKGALCMANSGPDTNGSQFYIVQKPVITEGYFDYADKVIEQYGEEEILYNSSTYKIFRTNYSEKAREYYNTLGGTPELDFGYSIFGQVFEGLDVIDAIAAAETDMSDKPVEDVVIESIEIVEY